MPGAGGDVGQAGPVPMPMEPPAWMLDRSRHGAIDEVPTATPGRLWLCGKHLVGPDPAAVTEALRLDRVVCLNQEHELVDRYPDYVRWLRADPSHRWWHPIPDLGAPPLDVFADLVQRIDTHLQAGESLLVHCGAGIGRAGTTAAGVRIAGGDRVDDAVAVVAAARPMAGPEAGPQRDVLAAFALTRRFTVERRSPSES